MPRRNGGADESDIIGSRAAKAAPDLGPLFGTPAPTEKRQPGPAGKRYSELPPSYDTQIGRHAERSRMPESAALRGKTARGSHTSELAARAVDDMVPTLAWLVLQHIKSCGIEGATREETAIALGRRMSSVTARIHELYVMGHIGSNCVNNCSVMCDHPPVSRINPETGLANEVLVGEVHVLRWRLDQSRPPAPLKHGRRNASHEREDDHGTDTPPAT